MRFASEVWLGRLWRDLVRHGVVRLGWVWADNSSQHLRNRVLVDAVSIAWAEARFAKARCGKVRQGMGRKRRLQKWGFLRLY